jgi:7-cyano-7-deazaguanine reductase
MNNTNTLANVHLGKTSTGEVMPIYVTPKHIDTSLLVSVPRSLNRVDYNLYEDSLPFIGVDVWNGYEFSTLLNSGVPINGVVKIIYSSNSAAIVESKSLKLYLNSFNMECMGSSPESAISSSIFRIEKDLSLLLQTDIQCNIFLTSQDNTTETNMISSFNLLKPKNEKFNVYKESSCLLTGNKSDKYRNITIRSDLLRSNCRVTNQPDWGDVYIAYRGRYDIDVNSILTYIISLRTENHFHEEICEMIYKRLWDKFNPEKLFVACLYTRRGGIDINPIRASSVDLYKYASNLTNIYELSNKTMRQ